MTGKIRKFGKYLQNRLTKIFLYAIVEQFFLNFRSNFMRNFYIVILAFLLFSCVDVEKKYVDYKINNEVQHFGAKRVELKKGVYVYQYDGTDNYSDFGLKGQYENEEEMTFMAWVCPDKLQDGPIIDNYSNLVWIQKDGSIKYHFKYKKTIDSKSEYHEAKSKSKYNLDEWIFITATYKQKQYVKIYVNGILENTTIHSNMYGINYIFTNYFIGKSEHGGRGKYFYMGQIDTDKINIYNKALSDGDIKSFYNKTK